LSSRFEPTIDLALEGGEQTFNQRSTLDTDAVLPADYGWDENSEDQHRR